MQEPSLLSSAIGNRFRSSLVQKPLFKRNSRDITENIQLFYPKVVPLSVMKRDEIIIFMSGSMSLYP